MIDQKRFFSDATFLMIAKVITLFIPVLLYPYLYRTLGMEVFSEIIFKLALIELISVIASYGFELTGVAFCSRNNENPKKISVFISKVILIKLLISIIVYSVVVFLFSFSQSSRVIDFTLLYPYLIFSQFLMPWFFVAISKPKLSVIIIFFSKLIAVFLIFSLVDGEHDVKEYYLAITVERLLVFIFFLWFFCKNYYFTKVKLTSLKCILVRDFSIFLSRALAMLFQKSTTLILGFLAIPNGVAIFDIVTKLTTGMKVITSSISQLAFPIISKTRSNKELIRFGVVICFCSLSTYALVVAFLEDIISILTSNTLSSYTLEIALLLIVFPITSFSSYLGSSGLLAFNKRVGFSKSIKIPMSMYFVCLSLILLFDLASLNTILTLFVFVEVFILSLRVYYVFKP